MKSGVRSLISAALFISSAALAGWNPAAWPSTNSYRIAPTNHYLATNLYGQVWATVWTQSSTTSFIPEVFDAAPILSINLTNDYTNALSGAWYGPIGGYTNDGYRAFTNVYVKSIEPDVSTSRLYEVWSSVQDGIVDSVSVEAVTTVSGVTVTNVLDATVTGQQTNITLGVERIWAYDTYAALVERVRVSDGDTNTYNQFESSDGIKFVWGGDEPPINDRANLDRFKAWLSGNAYKFVRTSAEIGGTFNAYFAPQDNWLWQSNVISFVDTNAYEDACSTGGVATLETITETNANWYSSSANESFPLWSDDALVVDLGLPHRADVSTNNYTAYVPGWFVGDTNVYYTNVTFEYVSTNISATWFDWSPYRDLGGWRPGLSNENAIVWRVNAWDSTLTNSSYNDLYDACGGVYRELRIPSPTNATPTQIIYQVERVYVVTTNAETITTGTVQIAHSTNVPHVAFSVTNVITTNAAQLVTNYLASTDANTNDYPGGWFTNIVFGPITVSNTYATNISATCFLTNIAPGYSERDYGYGRMRDVADALIYTVNGAQYSADTNSYPDIGLYLGFTCTTVAVDSAPFIHVETNAVGNPFGYKIAYAVSNAPLSDFAVTLCTNDVSCPASYGDLSGAVKYQTLEAGCYYVTTRSWDSTFVDCTFFNETFADSTEQYDAQTDVIVDYEYCCIPTNFPVDPVGSAKYQKTYTKIPCEVTNYLDCVTIGSNTYVYSYGRRSMAVTWAADDPQLTYSAAQYYNAINPITNSVPPDNESGWGGSLTNALIEYASTNATGNGSETDFYSTSKPFAGDSLESLGWEITQEFIMFRWNNTNGGFQYRP